MFVTEPSIADAAVQLAAPGLVSSVIPSSSERESVLGEGTLNKTTASSECSVASSMVNDS